MYKCNSCNNDFERAEERTVDAGGIRDIGIIGKAIATFIPFCPHCNSRNFVKEGEQIETTKEINQGTKGVLIGSWANY